MWKDNFKSLDSNYVYVIIPPSAPYFDETDSNRPNVYTEQLQEDYIQYDLFDGKDPSKYEWPTGNPNEWLDDLFTATITINRDQYQTLDIFKDWDFERFVNLKYIILYNPTTKFKRAYFCSKVQTTSLNQITFQLTLDVFWTHWWRIKWGLSHNLKRRHFDRFLKESYLGYKVIFNYHSNSPIWNTDQIESQYKNVIPTKEPKIVNNLGMCTYVFMVYNDAGDIFGEKSKIIPIKNFISWKSKTSGPEQVGYSWVESLLIAAPMWAPYCIGQLGYIDYSDANQVSFLGCPQIISLAILPNFEFLLLNEVSFNFNYVGKNWYDYDKGVENKISLKFLNRADINTEKDENLIIYEIDQEYYLVDCNSDEYDYKREPKLYMEPHFYYEFNWNVLNKKKVKNEFLLWNLDFRTYNDLEKITVKMIPSLLLAPHLCNLNWSINVVGNPNSIYNINEGGNYLFNWIITYTPNLASFSDASANFFQSNSNQFNTSALIGQHSYNLDRLHAVTSILGGILGMGVGAGIGGPAGTAMAAYSGMGLINSSLGYNDTVERSRLQNIQMFQSKKQDLLNTPNTLRDDSVKDANIFLNYDSRFFCTSFSLTDIDQQELSNHFNLYGYPCELRQKITDHSYFRTRLRFDFIMSEDITEAITEQTIGIEIQNWFAKMFKQGVRLFHQQTDKSFHIYEFDMENWELWVKPQLVV